MIFLLITSSKHLQKRLRKPVDRFGDAAGLNETIILDSSPEKVIKFNVKTTLLIIFNFNI